MLLAADFAIVHLCDVDHAGHRFGARSVQYLGAAQRAGEMSDALVRAWGWPDATVAIMADHGHRAGGGHGGGEPEVRESFLIMAGPGVAPNARVADGRTVDVAPTLAALLGVPAPRQATGHALTELLGLSPAGRAALAAADDERIAGLSPKLAAARRSLAAAETRGRILRGIAVGLGLALVLALASRRRDVVAFGLGLVGLAAALLAFRIVFGPISFSAARRAAVWGAGIWVLAFVAAALVLVVAIRAGGGRRAVLGVVAGFSPPALAAFVYAGLFATRLTCEPPWVAAAPPFAYLALGGACATGALASWFTRSRTRFTGS
jgi:hypothetical protein